MLSNSIDSSLRIWQFLSVAVSLFQLPKTVQTKQDKKRYDVMNNRNAIRFQLLRIGKFKGSSVADQKSIKADAVLCAVCAFQLNSNDHATINGQQHEKLNETTAVLTIEVGSMLRLVWLFFFALHGAHTAHAVGI